MKKVRFLINIDDAGEIFDGIVRRLMRWLNETP